MPQKELTEFWMIAVERKLELIWASLMALVNKELTDSEIGGLLEELTVVDSKYKALLEPEKEEEAAAAPVEG